MKKRKKNPSHERIASSSNLPSAGGLPGVVPPGDRPQVAPAGVLTKVAAILFGAALFIAIYLAWQSATGNAVAGCGPESGCAQILKSRWSFVLGVPVSLPGAGVYAFLLFAAIGGGTVSLSRRRWEWGASALVLGGALWFTIVQAFILRAFCPWCCTAHLLASVGVVVLWRARQDVLASDTTDRPALAVFALPVAAVAGLAIFQSVAPVPERIQERILKHSVVSGPGTISLHEGRIKLDPATLPLIGLPNAGMTTVILTDFTCPHCRELHRTLAQLAEQRPGQFNTVILPGAFEPEARELHRIMLAMWRIDRERYRKLAEGLVGGTVSPNAKDVLQLVQKQLDGRFYELAWAQTGWIQDTMRLGEELLALNSREADASTLPQIMIRDRVLTGAPHLETLVGLLEGAPELTVGAPAPQVAAAATSAASQPQAAAPEPAAAIAFEATTVDFGTVTKGDVATKKFTFTNSGGAPLTLKNIKAGCGCTTIKGWEQTVASGQQGSFEVKLDTANFAGAITKTIDVESNATNGKVRLSLNANVWSPVKLNATTISFGSVLKGAKVEPRNVEITVADPEPLKIGGVTCKNPYFQTEIKALEEGRRYQLTVSVPELGERPQHADLVLALGHPKLKEMKISAYINPVDPLVVQPRQIHIASATLQTNSTASVTVFCHDPAVARLEVTDLAYSGGSEVGVAFERKGDQRWGRVILRFPAGYTPSEANDACLSFHTNHPGYPEVKVPVLIIGLRSVLNQPKGNATQ